MPGQMPGRYIDQCQLQSFRLYNSQLADVKKP